MISLVSSNIMLRRSTGRLIFQPVTSSLPPIPPHVPFCHKNYDVAEQLALRIGGNESKRPFFLSKKSWESLTSLFDEFASNTGFGKEEWDRVEDFFRHLKEKAEDGELSDGDGEAIASVDLEDSVGESQESTEDILDLSEAREREDGELAKRVLRDLKNVKPQRLRANVNMMMDVVDVSFSYRKSRRSEENFEFTHFDHLKANLRELARTSGKYMLGVPGMRELIMLRALNGELSALKSVNPGSRTLFIMIDDSGSMDSTRKVAYINYTLMKIRERLSEDMEVYVFSFEKDLYDEYTDLSKGMPQMSLNGGGTNVERSLKSLVKRLPEFDISMDTASVLIINDGADEVGSFTPPCRVSSIILGTQNQGLKALCQRSGGKSYRINI
jgi:uncharacterized protein with von Willebrand factor type A (vWA) domain